jgi:hypothetical protein
MEHVDLASPLDIPVMPDAKDKAKENLRLAMPYFRKAVADASKNGVVKLCIISTKPDSSEKIEMQFDCSEFFKDLATVINAPEQTNTDDMKASALSFLQRHGLDSE